MRKQYTLFAGVNGAGKTSMYRALYLESKNMGYRINTDEIVSRMGSWKDNKLQMQAGKEAVTLINKYLEEGSTFHQETTLAGKTILKTIEKAKARGFYVVMNYIGIDSPKIAKERVAIRVAKGGHGIESEILEKRYYQSLDHLKQAFKICDEVHIYDNTTEMNQIMYIEYSKVQWKADVLPIWIQKYALEELMDEVIEENAEALQILDKEKYNN